MYRVGIDVGGTFTDLAAADARGRVVIAKSASTPRDPSEGLIEGLRKRLGPGGMVELTATVGYYAMIACTLNAFDVQPDPGADLLPV